MFSFLGMKIWSPYLTCTFSHLDLGLRVTAVRVTKKLMPNLQMCQVDRSHLYFLKKILVKKAQPISEYVRNPFLREAMLYVEKN